VLVIDERHQTTSENNATKPIKTGVKSLISGRSVILGSLSKPAYAALWKSSIRRIQLVSGFHLGQIWVTTFSSTNSELF